MAIKFKNNVSTALAADISASDTSIQVVNNTFPALGANDYCMATLIDDAANIEVVKVIGNASDTLTVVRAQEDTTARPFNLGSKIENRLTAGSLEEILNVTYASQAEVDAGVVDDEAVSPKTLKGALGTAAYVNTGTADDEVPLNSDLGPQLVVPQSGDADKVVRVKQDETGYELSDEDPQLAPQLAPQSIVKAPVGDVPDGWVPGDDCDRPTAHLRADHIVPHTSYWEPWGKCWASSEYSDEHEAWTTFNGTVSGGVGWASRNGSFSGNVGDESIYYSFPYDRKVEQVILYPRDLGTGSLEGFPVGLTIYIDDAEVYSTDTLPHGSATDPVTIDIPSPVEGKTVRIRVTKVINARFTAIGNIDFTFSDVSSGDLGIRSGLQVAYADEGHVKVSEELASTQTVTLPTNDGEYQVCANLGEDGTFSSFSFHDVFMAIGTQRDYGKAPSKDEYIIDGWWTATASSESSSPDGRVSGAMEQSYDKWWAATTYDSAWYSLALASPRKLAGVIIGRFPTDYKNSPSSYTVSVDGVEVGSKTSGTAQDWETDNVLMLDSPVEANNTIRIDFGHSIGNNSTETIATSYITPLFEDLFYNTATSTTYNSNNDIVRSVPIGELVMKDGKISDLTCYALGDSVLWPVNNGKRINKRERHLEPPVYPGMLSPVAHIKHSQNWGRVGWVIDSDGNTYGVMATYNTAYGLVIRTGYDFVTTSSVYMGNGFEDLGPISSAEKCRVHAKRGW